MGDKLLFIDTDAFILLAGAELLPQAIELLGLTSQNVYRLQALPHMLGKTRRIQQTYHPDVITRATIACDSFAQIDVAPDPEVTQRFADVNGIHEGEAMLLALMVTDPNVHLLSGDKTSMKAFAAADALSDLRSVVNGRVICVETILRELVTHHGSDVIGRRFDLFRDHKTVRVVFSDGCKADRGQCLEAIDVYINELKGIVGDQFLFSFNRDEGRVTCGPGAVF